MKAIQTTMQLTRASAKMDGSMSLGMSTPELTATEKATFMELMNHNLTVLIQPHSDPAEELVTVKAVLGFKTPSQRLRAVLYRRFEHEKPQEELFESYYTRKMEAIIDREKQHLPE